jgi:hypothetical protein
MIRDMSQTLPDTGPRQPQIEELIRTLKRVGLGQVSSGGSTLLSVPPADLAASSPQLALARALGVPFAPYILNIQNTFQSTSPLTLNPVSFQNPGSITQPSIVDRMMFEIDQPTAFDGQVLKSVQDFFFGLQSGIAATLDVTGAPRYTVAPFFTPLRTLCAMVNEGWPAGWVLNHTQNLVMQFQATQGALLTPPTIVTVSFRLWQPFSNEFVQMTDGEARSQLVQLAATMPVSSQVPAGAPMQGHPPTGALPATTQPLSQMPAGAGNGVSIPR